MVSQEFKQGIAKPCLNLTEEIVPLGPCPPALAGTTLSNMMYSPFYNESLYNFDREFYFKRKLSSSGCAKKSSSYFFNAKRSFRHTLF